MANKRKTQSSGVDKRVKKQLAEDINSLGGPHAAFKLEDLLKREDRDLYSEYRQPSKAKRSIQNLVNEWKRYKSLEDWLESVYIPSVIEDASDEEEYTEATTVPKPTQPKPQPAKSPITRPPTTRPKSAVSPEQTYKKMPQNKLGKQLVLPLPKGLYLVVIWAECNLSNIELSISDDGYSVNKRTKKPKPQDASELLGHYPWAKDCDNVVVSTVDDALADLKKEDTEDWEESKLVDLDKEVIREFVDNRGKPFPASVASVGQRTDQDGRKVITFFLKTVDAHRTTPAKVKFGSGGPAGMQVCSDESSNASHSYAEETVEEVRAEMDEMKQQIEKMMNAQQLSLQQQNQTMQEQMQQMMGFMQQLAQQQQQQQQQQVAPHGVVPDGAPSSGMQY